MKRLTLGGGLLFAVTMFTLAACDSAGPEEPPDPGPQTITLTLDPTHADSTVTQATLIDAEADTALGVGTQTVTRPLDSKLNLRVESDTFQTYATTVTFAESSHGQTRRLELAITLPEFVRVAFAIRADPGDTLVALPVVYNDSLVAENAAEATVRLPYSTTGGQLCVPESEYFEFICQAVTPDQQRLPRVTFQVHRKQVGFQAAIVDSADGEKLDGWITIDGALLAGDGHVEIERFKVAGTAQVKASAAGFDTTAVSVPRDEPQDLTLSVRDLPDCSDGIDNDGDGWTDAQDGGCINSDKGFGSYEPEDDNEVLRRHTTEGFGTGVNGREFVSSASDHQQRRTGSYSYPLSIQSAIDVIHLQIESMVEADQDDETFAVKYSCGSKISTTAAVADTANFTGWRIPKVHGIDASFFSDGIHCERWIIHGTKARGEPPGDGEDDVVFGTPNHYGGRDIYWYYEPEEVPEEPADKYHRQTTSKNVDVTDTEVGRRNRR